MVEFKRLYPDPVETEVEPELKELGGRISKQDLDRRYMTVREAAEALQVVPMTVYRMLKRNELRMTRVGPRKIMVFRADVEKIITPTYYTES